ncbi:MAG: outer membrane protein assembly factor BamD [Balneolaceae bacterium]
MRTFVILFLAVLTLTSCRSQDLIRPGDSLEVAFEKAKSQYDDEDWTDAARSFETVISIGRGTDVGQEAQYLLAESYYNSRRYLLAASEYERYATFYPRSERREEVDFKTGLSYYQMSPRYRLDQTYTRTAIDNFRLFNSRYPESDRREEAAEFISELREKLARKQYTAAEFYMRTNRYNAAAVYYDLVIDEYPETEWAEQALVDQIDAYILYADNSVSARQKERYEQALESYSRYLQLFPQGDNRSRAEDLYDEANEKVGEIEQQEAQASAQIN